MLLVASIFPVSFFNQTGEWTLSDVLVYTVSLSVVPSPSLVGGALDVSFSGGDSGENIFAIEKNLSSSPLDLSAYSYLGLVLRYEGSHIQSGLNIGIFLDDGGGYKEFNYPSGDGWWLNFNNHVGVSGRWYLIIFSLDPAFYGGTLNKASIVGIKIKMTDYIDSESPSGDIYFDALFAMDVPGLKELGYYSLSFPSNVSGTVPPGGRAYPVEFTLTANYTPVLYSSPSLIRVDVFTSSDIDSTENYISRVLLEEGSLPISETSYCSTSVLLCRRDFNFTDEVSFRSGFELKDTFVPGTYLDASANVFMTFDGNADDSSYLVSFGQSKGADVETSVDATQNYFGKTDGSLKVSFTFPSHSGTGSYHFMIKRWAAQLIDSSYSTSTDGMMNYMFLAIHVPVAPSYSFAVGPLLIEADGSIYEYDTWWDYFRVSSSGDYEWVFELNPSKWSLMGGSYDENGQLDFDQIAYAALKIDDLNQEGVVVSGIFEIKAFGLVKAVSSSGYFSISQDKILVDTHVAPDRVSITSDGRFLVYNADGYIKMKRIDSDFPYNGTEYLLSYDFDRFIHPCVSPDGTKVAMVDSTTEDDSEIYIASLAYDASGNPYVESLEKFTDNDANDFWPSFSPDGKWFIFWSNRAAGRADVYIQNIETKELIKATFQSVDQPGCFDPSFSPDMTRFAYMGGLDPFWKIFVKDMDSNKDGVWDDVDFSVENGFNRKPYQVSPEGDRVMWWSENVLLIRESGALVARDLEGNLLKEILPSSYGVQNFVRVPGKNEIVAVVGNDPYSIIKFSVDIPQLGEATGSYVSAEGEPYTRLYTSEKLSLEVLDSFPGGSLKAVKISPSQKIADSTFWIDVTDLVNSGDVSLDEDYILLYWDGLHWRKAAHGHMENIDGRWIFVSSISFTGTFGIGVDSATASGVPKVFSPNGDGINDFLVFTSGSDASELEVSIYGANGNLVFSSKIPVVFDGKAGGVELPGGIYFYVLKDSRGNVLGKGTFLLLR